MPRQPVELPDNLPDCHVMILRQAEQIEALEARVDQLMARVDELVAEVAGLKRQLHGSRRERFVAPRSDDELQPPDPETDQAEPRPPRTSRLGGRCCFTHCGPVKVLNKQLI